jgi:hypothetical protein
MAAGYAAGYPVLLDINLDAQQARLRMQFLGEGAYLNARFTRSLDAYLLIRSSVLRAAGYLHMAFRWDEQGDISMLAVTQVRSMLTRRILPSTLVASAGSHVRCLTTGGGGVRSSSGTQ